MKCPSATPLPHRTAHPPLRAQFTACSLTPHLHHGRVKLTMRLLRTTQGGSFSLVLGLMLLGSLLATTLVDPRVPCSDKPPPPHPRTSPLQPPPPPSPAVGVAIR